MKYTKAMVRLGAMYMRGDTGQIKVSAAVKLFNGAASEGDSDAMCWLGKLSLSGEGMVRSVANAKKWLSKASVRGNTEAKELLSQPPFV